MRSAVYCLLYSNSLNHFVIEQFNLVKSAVIDKKLFISVLSVRLFIHFAVYQAPFGIYIRHWQLYTLMFCIFWANFGSICIKTFPWDIITYSPFAGV